MFGRHKESYSDWLKAEFGGMIDDLDLQPTQKRFIRSRWLDQLAWYEAKANGARTRYYALRLTTVVGAVLVPALVTVNTTVSSLDVAARVATWIVSLVVAVSAAVEQFFRFGERWRHYRQAAELLKAEGWLFLQLGGAYGLNGATHDKIYAAFATRVEELIKSDVDVYLTQVAIEREKKEEEAAKTG
jgi:hypothetical protein